MRLASALGALLAVPAFAEAPSKRPPPSDPHDISGVWFQAGGYNPSYDPDDGSKVSFTAAGAAEYKRRKDAYATGNPVPDPPTQCWPHGVPRAMLVPSPIQIIQAHGRIAIVIESGHNIRNIYMDEKQPSQVGPTLMGHSVGHWEGDTLVIDTIGLNPKAWLDEDGKPETAQLHVVERVRKLDGGKQLEDSIAIDDPGVFTKPWTAKRLFNWRPDMRVVEYICEENLRDDDTAFGPPPKQ
jgi:hypothetical protein